MIPYAEVIGDPIAHSKSPLIHGFWIGALGIAAEYRRTHVRPEELAEFYAARAQDAAWRGCNVTIPHKETSLAFVADPEGVKASIGAINCVLPRGGGLIGTNTDAAGFIEPIADRPLAGAHAVVVGAGGAARAILFALARAKVGSVTILNRNVEKAAALLGAFGLAGEALPLGSAIPPAALVVNASALGMKGQPPLEIDLAPLPAGALVYDIVYAPLETALLAQARARSLATIDGLAMLIGQARLAFEHFFGATPPRDRDAELRALLLAA